MPETIEIIVNGESRRVAEGIDVRRLLDELGLAPERVAIELNRSILPRRVWEQTKLSSDDRVEIVHFVGGG
jgi:thiamine biosynthesis protein ThiS